MTSAPTALPIQTTDPGDDQPVEVRQAVARLASVAPELLQEGATAEVLAAARAAARQRAIRESCSAAVAALTTGVADPDATPGLLHALGVEAAGAERLLQGLPEAAPVDLPPDLAALALTAASNALQAAAGIEITAPTYARAHDQWQSLPPGRRGVVTPPTALAADVVVSREFAELLREAADLGEQCRRWRSGDNGSGNVIDKLIVASSLLLRAEKLRERATELEPKVLLANAERKRLGLTWTPESAAITS